MAVAPDSELVEVLRRAGATVLDVTLTGRVGWTDASLRLLVRSGAGMTVVLATIDVCGSADACGRVQLSGYPSFCLKGLMHDE